MLGALFGGDKGKTFRPVRAHGDGSRLMRLHKHAQATLGTGNLRDAVSLPEGEDRNEWIAALTTDFFNEVNLAYGMIAEFCTAATCPMMNAGPKWQYKWADGKKHITPVDASAPQYVDYLMAWVQTELDDTSVFPVAPGVSFPNDFLDHVRNIFRRLFRVYAHIYHCHFERVVSLSFESHLNTMFKHFMYFVAEFDLVGAEELKPLQPLMDKMRAEDDVRWGQGQHAAVAAGPP